ncbi:hypothetical protein ACFY3U_08030 [Micromonospora sp. NPDC000089]|uniref:hypothetical protein n=1 Tax=unclassified Micromonospora TaxID=2617518 RepID=UPI0036C2EC86
MRSLLLSTTALSLSLLTTCTTGPQNVTGDAGPAGVPVATVSGPTASTPAGPDASVGSPRQRGTGAPAGSSTAGTGAGPTAPTARPKPTGVPSSSRTSVIRKTDWANMTLRSLSYMGFTDATFRDGRASAGANNCTMLPGGAQPVYAEYLTEEPASSPVTEDALILIECGSDAMEQALVPVQVGFDQRTRQARGLIVADPTPGPNRRMTFTSYRVEGGTIVTTVRKADGGSEVRRYRNDGGDTWTRS